MRAGLMAEFAGPRELVAAVRALREGGYTELDAYTPYPVHGIEAAMGLRRTRLPWFVLAGGLTGAAFAYLFQLWIQYDYPIDLGGRPLHAAPAFIPITFETGVLFAALTTFFGLLAFARLPRLWHPVFEVEGFERASIDRFWLAVPAHDHELERVREQIANQLKGLGALRVIWVGDLG